MYIYLLLLFSIVITTFTYFIARNNKWSMLYYLFPEKYLIKNKLILKYLFNPKDKVPIWLWFLHLSQLFFLFIIFAIYIAFWINKLFISILSSYWVYVIFFIQFLMFFVPISCIHGYMFKKYIENKNKN